MASPRKDGDIVVVEDAAASLRNLRKDKDAQWVMGLRPEDEFIAPKQRVPQSNRDDTVAGHAATLPEARPRGRWLLLPVVLGFIWLAMVASRIALLHDVSHTILPEYLSSLIQLFHEPVVDNFFGALTLGLEAEQGNPNTSQMLWTQIRVVEFPPNEYEAWTILRQYIAVSHGSWWGIGLFAVMPTTVVAICASVFVTLLSFRFAVATEYFTCYCSVGVATLGTLFAVSTAAIFSLGCTSASRDDECAVPLVSLWCTSMMRYTLPFLALLPVAWVLDSLQRSWVWRALVAAPVVAYGSVAFVSVYYVCNNSDGTLCGPVAETTFSSFVSGSTYHYGTVVALLEFAEVLSLLVGFAVVVKCWSQKPIGLVPLNNFVALPPYNAKKEQ